MKSVYLARLDSGTDGSIRVLCITSQDVTKLTGIIKISTYGEGNNITFCLLLNRSYEQKKHGGVKDLSPPMFRERFVSLKIIPTGYLSYHNCMNVT